MVLASGTSDVVLALLTGSTVTALLGYLGLRLKSSGRVRNTNADQLWEQESRIRETLERDNQRLRAEFEAITGQVFELRAQAVDVGARMTRATFDVRRLKDHLREARAENARLRIEIVRLRGEGS